MDRYNLQRPQGMPPNTVSTKRPSRSLNYGLTCEQQGWPGPGPSLGGIFYFLLFLFTLTTGVSGRPHNVRMDGWKDSHSRPWGGGGEEGPPGSSSTKPPTSGSLVAPPGSSSSSRGVRAGTADSAQRSRRGCPGALYCCDIIKPRPLLGKLGEGFGGVTPVTEVTSLWPVKIPSIPPCPRAPSTVQNQLNKQQERPVGLKPKDQVN